MLKRNILRPPLWSAVFLPWQSQVLNHSNQYGLHCWGIDFGPRFRKFWKWKGVRNSRPCCGRKPFLALNYLRYMLAYHPSDSLVSKNTETSGLSWTICHTNWHIKFSQLLHIFSDLSKLSLDISCCCIISPCHVLKRHFWIHVFLKFTWDLNLLAESLSL